MMGSGEIGFTSFAMDLQPTAHRWSERKPGSDSPFHLESFVAGWVGRLSA